ncbi:hypothetical protein G6F57_012437 [Rhizopus arrhizus]|nr:hypothetical protein G6F57_012437 [Rhizopus arrhizus]
MALLRWAVSGWKAASRVAQFLPLSVYRTSTAVSFFANVELVPGDPILGLTEAYNADSRPTKVNLGVGIYYDESGRIPLLRAVKQIEQQLAAEAKPRGYLPIDGLPAYTQATRELVFGKDSPLLAAGRVTTAQTVGGSGALRVGADVLKKLLPHATRGRLRGGGLHLLRPNHPWRRFRRHAGRPGQAAGRHRGAAARLLPQPHRRRPHRHPVEAGRAAAERQAAVPLHRHGLPGLRQGHRAGRRRRAHHRRGRH